MVRGQPCGAFHRLRGAAQRRLDHDRYRRDPPQVPDDEKPFGAENLHADIRQGKATVPWQAGQASERNLGGANRTLDGVRHAVPIADGILSRDGWYVLDDSKSVLAANDWFTERPADKALDWYLFGYGLDFKAALKSLTTISGPVPLPRKYTMGVWYSRYWAYSADDFKQIVAEYHQHQFPLDVLVMDMDWHPIDTKVPGVKRAYLNQVWTGYTWNKNLIPDPPGLLRWLHDQGVHVTLNDHPADGIQPHEEMYPAFMRAMGKDPNSGAPFHSMPETATTSTLSGSSPHVPREKEGVDFWWLDWQQFPQTFEPARPDQSRHVERLLLQAVAGRWPPRAIVQPLGGLGGPAQSDSLFR